MLPLLLVQNQRTGDTGNEMRAIADELIICTDDGSYGRKDLVTAH